MRTLRGLKSRGVSNMLCVLHCLSNTVHTFTSWAELSGRALRRLSASDHSFVFPRFCTYSAVALLTKHPLLEDDALLHLGMHAQLQVCMTAAWLARIGQGANSRSKMVDLERQWLTYEPSHDTSWSRRHFAPMTHVHLLGSRA